MQQHWYSKISCNYLFLIQVSLCHQDSSRHIYLTNQYPKATNDTPAIRLAATYVIKPKILPSASICTLSFAKVENVVKPPQMPVVSSKHQWLPDEPFLANSANSTPKTRQPTRFTANVSQGKALPHTFPINVERRNLNPPPMKLPEATSNTDLSIQVLKFFILHKKRRSDKLHTLRRLFFTHLLSVRS